MMLSFNCLITGDKVIDKHDSQVLEYDLIHSVEYLSNEESKWMLFQFNPKDFERYDGDKQVGEYDEQYLARYCNG